MDSQVRTKKAKKNIIAMFFIRGLSIAITFLYVPLLLNTLNPVEYGIWLTLTSIVAWINMFDIGLGNGLRNKLSEALAKDDLKKGKELVSTSYVSIFLLAIILLIIFSSIFPFVSWIEVLNAPYSSASMINDLVYIVVAAFLAQFSLSLITSILYALQEPFLSSLILLIGQALSFIAVYIEAKILGIDSLLVLGATISVIPLLTMSCLTFYFFKFRYPYLSPNIKLFDKRHIRSIFSLGIQFFILQIISIVLFQANNLIITHCTGPSDVVVYNVAFKLMHSPVLIFTIIVTPMWSAATDAYTRGDFDWLKQINLKLYKIIGIISIGALILLVISPWIYPVWLRTKDLAIPFSTSLILLMQSIFFMLFSCHGYMLNGMGKLRLQMIITSLLAISYIPLAYYCGVEFGLNGVLVIFMFNAVINFVWSSIQFRKVVNNKAVGLWNR